jgi:iron complex transport system substrate-binding protein
MTLPGPSRRTLLVGSAAGGLLLAGCGSDSEPAPAAAPSGTPSDAPSAGPRTVPGALGDLVIEGTPTRVVSVGQYRDTDAAVALGVVPLLSPDLSTFVEGGITPWVLDALDGAELELYDTDDLPFEKIAAAAPELILATDRSALADGEYDLLTKIAPTLSWQNGYNRDDWRTTTGRVGAALGLPEQAAGVVAKVEGAITAARSANPQLTGVTFTLGPVTAEGAVNTISSVEDAAVQFFNELGLVLSPTVRDLPDAAFPGRATIAAERLDLLEADVLMLTYNTPAARERMESNKLFTSLKAVQEGRYVALDLTDALALGFPSALSIQYAVDVVLPKIIEVV